MRSRADIHDLELQGSSNLKRAREREALPQLEHREDLETQYRELKARRALALEDVKKNGLIIEQEKVAPRGQLIMIKIPNPALKIAQQCERQMASLAKLLTLANFAKTTTERPFSEILENVKSMMRPS